LPTAVAYYRKAHKIIIIIPVFIYLCANLTAQRPVIKLANVRRKKREAVVDFYHGTTPKCV
jgi:hypothetical protein